MSLISLSSVNNNNLVSQQPFNFKNSFPQPIILKPNSQVALLNFYHFRDDNQYHITNQNNKLLFNWGASANNGRWEATLNPNIYTGDDLATEIARAMNESNIAFQNYLFTVSFTAGNPQASPPVNDVFEITYASVGTPTKQGGVWTNFTDSGNCVISNLETDNSVSSIAVGTNTLIETYQARQENGIHNHEGAWCSQGYSDFGFNSDGLNNANSAYAFNYGSHNVSLFEVKRTSTISSNMKTIYSPSRPTVDVNIRTVAGSSTIRISTLNGTTNKLVLKKLISSEIFDKIRDALFPVGTDRADFKVGFNYIKDGAGDVAIQLKYSSNGGITYTIATEADNTGAVFGTSSTGGQNPIITPRVQAAMTIGADANVNGIIWRSKTSGLLNTDGSTNNTFSSSNILKKIKGKYECFVLGKSGALVPAGLGSKIAKFELNGITFTKDYGGGGSAFDCNITNHAGGVAFDYDLAGVNQTGNAAANQVIATNLTPCALKQNLTKDSFGLVYDIHADKTDANSAVIGELKICRRATGNSNRGRVNLQSLTAGSFSGATELKLMTTNSLISSVAAVPMTVEQQGIYNQDNRQILSGGSIQSAGHASQYDESNLETIPHALVGADLSSTFCLLLGRISQNDIDTIAGIGSSPANLTANSISGTLGSLIGFEPSVIISNTATTATFRTTQKTLITSKDTTLHISIPELSNVKSFEGESSQRYKTIKVIPKADFDSDSNSGSLSFTANYEDYIDINNGTELQLSELTVQIRQPDGTLATTLKPITRTTIKFRENPLNKEMEKMEKMLEMMERKASQNQQMIKDVSKPPIVYS